MLDSIIFKSEIDFRYYVLNSYDKISRIVLFEDELDNTIFFYCFTYDNWYVGTKERLRNNFSYFCDVYEKIGLRYNLNIDYGNYSSKVLRKEEKHC